jgi:hypothetical protein
MVESQWPAISALAAAVFGLNFFDLPSSDLCQRSSPVAQGRMIGALIQEYYLWALLQREGTGNFCANSAALMACKLCPWY